MKCPNCNQDIRYLLFRGIIQDEGIYSLTSDIQSSVVDTQVFNYFYCPLCGSLLTKSIEDVISWKQHEASQVFGVYND